MYQFIESRKPVTALAPFVCMFGGLGGNALAEGIEEVVVTAQKRAEDLQDVPIAISAFTQDTMRDMGITNTQDLQLATPGLVFAAQGVLGQPYLRGVGTRFTLNGLDPSIATYIGDRYVPRGSGNQLDLGLDVERIEVLKGPQGILYGRNATGGAIRVIKKGVSDEFEGEVKATAGNYDLYELGATVNIPISENFGMRLSGSTTQRDGWQDNLARDLPGAHAEFNDRNISTFSGMFKWDMTDRFSANLALDYWTQDDTRGQEGSGVGPPELNVGTGLGGLFSTGRKHAATDTQQKNDGNQLGSELKLEYAADSFDFTAITTYADWEQLWTSEGDGTSASLFTPAIAHDQSDTWSQEIRAVSSASDSLRWTVGAFYYDDKHETEFEFNTLILPNTSQGFQTTDTTAYAVFGQVGWDLSERWALTLGARYSYEERDVSVLPTSRPGLTTLGAAGLPFNKKDDWDEITPQATLEHHFDNAMVYLTYSRGFKSGGFNYPATTTPDGLDPEVLDMIELGMKGDYFNGTLRLNASAYYYDYTDLQVQRASSDTGVTTTENAANAEILGLEVDAIYAPTDALTLRFGFNFTDSQYKDYEAAQKVFRATLGQTTASGAPAPGMVDQPFDADGESLLRAPDFSAFATLGYEFTLPSGYIPLSITYSYKDSFWYDFSTDPIAAPWLEEDGYGLLSAKIGWVSADDRWSASLWGRNLTDETYHDEVAGNAMGLRAYYGDPRMYGVDLQYSFGR
jgi:iron complex outermembrane receptor protein